MNDIKTRVAIVTPVHNRRDITLQCLKSLSRLNLEGLDVRTIVVDDGSTDGTSAAIGESFPDVEIVRGDGNLWFTEGTNVGVRVALEKDPEFVLMMNDDQVFDADFLQYLVETATRYPRSVVGSLLLLWDKPHKLFQTSPLWETAYGGWRHWQNQTVWTIPRTAWEVELIVGNCVLVPVEAIRECGVMNSTKYPNFGDAEYTPRLRRNGWKLLIDPRARVFCQPNTIPKQVRKMSVRQKFNALFIDLGHIQNLRRRFFAYWDGAPTHLEGVLAYFIFLVRAILGINTESAWGEKQIEPPIAETFRLNIVKQ